MKLAFDNAVSKRSAETIRDRGHEVVVHALYEHDELWLRRAMDGGAEIFFSHDWDVDIFCNSRNKKCVRLTQGMKQPEIVKAILKAIRDHERESAHVSAQK